MKKSRLTNEQIIGFLKQADGGVPVKELCRQCGFSDASFYTWRAKFLWHNCAMCKAIATPGSEECTLKKLLAEAILDAEALRIALGREH